MEDILEDQKAYYRARANEYDEWFERKGRYDRGPILTARWNDDAAEVRAALGQLAPFGDALEFAGGTGIWTQEIAPHARTLTVVDASQEMLAINRTRVAPIATKHNTVYDTVEADIYDYKAPTPVDFIFFGFWLSHVPQSHFERFWDTVRSALKPSGRGYFVDAQFQPEALARDVPHPENDHAERRLNDGRTFRIIKRFYEPQALASNLEKLGFKATIKATPSFFIHGSFELA